MVLLKNRQQFKYPGVFGVSNTTGLDEMDYLIADKEFDIDEKVKKLFIYLKFGIAIMVINMIEYLIQRHQLKKFITFGSFNNFRKDK